MTRRLLMSALGALVLAVVTISSTAAHAELITSSPVAGANLTTAPTEVTITFDDELDPDLSSFEVTGPGSVEVGTGEVNLTVADRNVMTGAVVITVPGVYTVTYRFAGVDGHQLEASFSFGFQATSPIPDPTGEEDPDTAMAARRDGPPLAPLGMLLLLLSAGLLLRRVRSR